jgi:tetratricopeptide (TPR) repeat protein
MDFFKLFQLCFSFLFVYQKKGFSFIVGALILFASAILMSNSVHAQELDQLRELSRLITTGQLTSAQMLFEKIEKEAGGRPDVEFYKGVLLSEQGRSSEAIAVYRRLIENFPEMPEAHNNLGVLLAAEGFLDQARESFIKAVQAYPAYGTAYENLADLYVRLANQAYQNASRYSQDNPTLTKKKEELSVFLFEYALERPTKKQKVPSTKEP